MKICNQTLSSYEDLPAVPRAQAPASLLSSIASYKGFEKERCSKGCLSFFALCQGLG